MNTKTKKMKVSKWLESNVSSHAIYREPAMSENYQKNTGRVACWNKHSVEDTNESFGEFKGVVSKIKGQPKEGCSYGYEIATSLQLELTGTYNSKNGRGFQYQEALQTLKEAGK